MSRMDGREAQRRLYELWDIVNDPTATEADKELVRRLAEAVPRTAWKEMLEHGPYSQ